jgi:hypothetical protein
MPEKPSFIRIIDIILIILASKRMYCLYLFLSLF